MYIPFSYRFAYRHRLRSSGRPVAPRRPLRCEPLEGSFETVTFRGFDHFSVRPPEAVRLIDSRDPLETDEEPRGTDGDEPLLERQP